MIWSGDGVIYPIMEARCYMPHSLEAAWGVAWAWWYIDPGSPDAEAPTGPVLATCQLYDQIKSTANETTQINLMNQILQIAADNFFCMGVSTSEGGYGIRKNSLKNVPKNMIAAWVFPNPAPYNCFTFYFENKVFLPTIRK